MPDDLRLDEMLRVGDGKDDMSEEKALSALSTQLQTNGKEQQGMFENIKETAQKYLPDLSFINGNPGYELGRSIVGSGILPLDISAIEKLVKGAPEDIAETTGKAIEGTMTGIGQLAAKAAEKALEIGVVKPPLGDRTIRIDGDVIFRIQESPVLKLSENEIKESISKLKENAEREKEREEKRLSEEAKKFEATPEQTAKRIGKSNKEIDASAKVAEMILNGDLEALEKLVSTKDGSPANLKRVAQMLKDAGFNLVVEQDRHGRLLISHPGDDRAVMIEQNGRADIIGIKDGKYDFEAEYVNADPKSELNMMMIRAKGLPRVELKPWVNDIKPSILFHHSNKTHNLEEQSGSQGSERRPVENINAIYANPEK